MQTFKDLYEFLQSYEEPDILSWLEQTWRGKDKQESLLRLFSSLGLIDKFADYEICKGNFNLVTIEPIKCNKEIFYDEKNNPIFLKDSGDKSDLHAIINTPDKKAILATTSKNLNIEHIGDLDLREIKSLFYENYKDNGYELHLCLCIRNKKRTEKMIGKVHKSNEDLQFLLNKKTTIIIDWNDLNNYYKLFKQYFQNISINDILKNNLKPVILKMHQEYGTELIMNIKKSGEKRALLGFLSRSGKSYIICGCIIADSQNKDECNYLVISTAPNETTEQLIKVFNCLQLREFNIINLDGSNKKPVLTKKNISICSKQFLQTKIEQKNLILEKTKSIKWLKDMKIDMRFLDESHNGGTTELAQKTLDYYGKDAFTVQITATYSKPVNDYNIPQNCWVLWDLEDIQLCKNISNPEKKQRLIEKHGSTTFLEKILAKYTDENIIIEYSKYPDLWILTDEIKPEIVNEIISQTTDNNYGWSTEACFLLQQSFTTKINSDGIKKNIPIVIPKFQNEEENLKIWYRIFGKKNSFGIPDKEYPETAVFINRIENICKNKNSRFMGDGETTEPFVIMAFLPQKYINTISKATKNILEKNKVVPYLEIICINSAETTDPVKCIKNAQILAKINGKKGVLVLSGRQCSLGVSLKMCDIVIILNNNISFDLIFQMMFRSMTEENGKKFGFVIDLNIHRVIDTTIQYSSLLQPAKHPKNALKYLLQEQIIHLNADHWMECFNHKEQDKINSFVNNFYTIYSSNIRRALGKFLNCLSFNKYNSFITTEEQRILNSIKYHYNTAFEKNKDNKEKTQQIKKGVKKEADENYESNSENNDENEEEKEEEIHNEKKVNYTDIIKHIIPLICIFTIYSTETDFVKMYSIIEDDPVLLNILLEQIKSWWGQKIDVNIIKLLIQIYIKYMQQDTEITQIITTIKELFLQHKNNRKEFSLLLDKYLIPQELEKKTNAEVSTPFKLRQEMLDKIPSEFWQQQHTVFEPCSGKGGFIIDIIDRFMEGLKETIPDEKERYRTIVEECLYFSDINPTNIFICKLLADPNNEYTLNYNEGNTLELDIKTIWKIDGFDAVIGNPPYNSSGNTGTGNTIWQHFTRNALTKWLKSGGYLCFVHPSGWRKPNTERGKYYKMFDLMTKENQMLYLEIHGIKDGMKMFGCGTRYDWFIIEKTPVYKETIIIDEEEKKDIINLNTFSWLPNSKIEEIEKIIAKNNVEQCPIIYNRSNYGSDKKEYISIIKTEKFKYPCIHTIPLNGIRYLYSSVNNKGHFGISKVIFGDNGLNDVIIDMHGEYGMSENSMALEVKNIEEANNIKKALLSNKFKNIMKACIIGNFRIDWRIFITFRRDFYKEFI